MAKHKTKQDPNPTPAERKLVDALPMEKIIAMADEARVKYGDDLAAYVQIYNDGEYNITVAARPPQRGSHQPRVSTSGLATLSAQPWCPWHVLTLVIGAFS